MERCMEFIVIIILHTTFWSCDWSRQQEVQLENKLFHEHDIKLEFTIVVGAVGLFEAATSTGTDDKGEDFSSRSHR